MNIARVLHAVVQQRPDAPAITFEGDTWSYARFWQAIGRWTAQLRPDLAPGTRVLCVAPNHPEVLALYVAVTGLGAIFVPISPELTGVERDYLAEVTQPAVTVDPIEQPRGSKPVLEAADFPDLAADTAALVCFTSGNTGRPKGVLASHRNEIASARQYAQVWAIGPADRVLVALPLSFLYGLTTGALTTLLAGGSVLLEPRFHPETVLRHIADGQATVFMGVPTMYAMMLQVGLEQPEAFDLFSVRLMLTAGAPIAPATLEAFRERFSIDIMDFYALSEVRPVFAYDSRRFRRGRPGSCGHRLRGVDVRIIDPAGVEVTEPGQIGELVVRSDTLMQGYYGEPERTAEVLRDGWFSTGDLATFDDEGFFSIVGRKKDLIIRGGVNVAPAEVEQAILQHPAVLEAAVFGIPDAVFGEEIVAAVTPRTGGQVDEAALLAFLSDRLAGYKQPRHIRVMASLPRGTTGKIAKRELVREWPG